MTKRTSLYLLSLAVAASLVAVPAMAQDAKDKDDQNKVTGSVTVGAQTGNGMDTSSKLQQYETVTKGVILQDALLNWQNGSHFISFSGKKLGLDDQDAWFNAGTKGTWSLNMSLNQNQRWFSNQAATLYSQPTPGTFTLPDGMRTSLQKIWSPYTAGGETAAPANSSDDRFWSLRDYMEGAQPVDLRYVRKTGNVGFNLNALEDWTFKASYQREMRDGSQPLAFTAGPGIDEVANPIQYTTQNTRAEVEYAKSKFFLNGAFTYSQFDNAVPFTTVDNPVRYNNLDYFWTSGVVNNTTANAAARLWNAPSNKATSFDVTAGYSLPMQHKLTLTFSDMVMKNDFNFIAQATNPNLGATVTGFSLAPEYAQYNGKLDQTLFMANFTGEPSPYFGYSVYYRVFDLKDKAPSYTFHSTVNSDGGGSYSATGTSTDDAGFKTEQTKFEIHFKPATGVRFGFNATHAKDTFEDRQYVDLSENTYGVTLDANLKIAMFHGAYSKATRTPGAINAGFPAEGTTGGPLDVNAGWRDIDRQDAKNYSATLTFMPMDGAALAVFASGTDFSYPGVSIGLGAYNVKNYGVDYTLALTDKVTLNAAYIYEKIHQDNNFWSGANGTVAAPVATNIIEQYYNKLDDKVNTAKFGLTWAATPKVEFGTSYDYSKGTSDSHFLVNPGGSVNGDLLFPSNATTVNFPQFQYLDMPQVYNTMATWKTWFNYHVDKNVTFQLMYWHQKFDQADYAYDLLSPYMLPGVQLYASTPGAVSTYYNALDASANRAIFLNAAVPNFNANIVRASLTVKF